jgi:hypothetical protein
MKIRILQGRVEDAIRVGAPVALARHEEIYEAAADERAQLHCEETERPHLLQRVLLGREGKGHTPVQVTQRTKEASRGGQCPRVARNGTLQLEDDQEKSTNG